MAAEYETKLQGFKAKKPSHPKRTARLYIESACSGLAEHAERYLPDFYDSAKYFNTVWSGLISD